jgi:predicted glycosyltransferase
MKRVAFYCQHVLGIGHLVRSTEILRALCREFSVLLIGGGRPVEGFRFPPQVEVVNLPPLETDADFGALRAVSGAPDLETIQQARKAMLLSVLDRFAPDAFIVELFPFGRKRFAFELIPALEKVRGGPAPARAICSLRDILVAKRDQAAHEERVCGIVNRYFDRILVHGDPRFQRLEATFARVAGLRCPVEYTGYVVQRPAEQSEAERAEAAPDVPHDPFVIVTIGSGRYVNGHRLLEAVIQAAPLVQQRIVIFAGPFIPDAEFRRLREMAERQPNVRFERYTPDLLPYMRRADLSISMGGYNTIMNILSTGTRAIVFPYTANDDQEQYIRAEKLHALGIVEMIHPGVLEPVRLAGIIRTAMRKSPAPRNWRMDGAEASARAISRLLHSRARAAEALRA